MRTYDASASSYEVGFEIGFDICRYGFLLEDSEHEELSIRNGYDSARTQNTSRIQPDKFEKKLLQIRRRAFRKGILVSISVEDLKRTLEATNNRCSVLNIKLTFSTGNESDWSVDRLDNDLGYYPENIFIMSSQANRAKDDISFEEILLYVNGIDREVLLRKPQFKLHDKRFWQKLYLAIFDRMPVDMFCEKAQEFFLDDKNVKLVRDQVVMEIIMSAVDDGSNAMSIKLFENEIKKSDLISSVLPPDFFSKADLIKIRKSALKVLDNFYRSQCSSNDHVNVENKNMQEKLCAEFMTIKRSSGYISSIEKKINEVIKNSMTCGLILGVISQRYREYGR